MSHDTLVHAALRPLVRAVRPLGVTPDQVTLARLVTGLAAAALLASGSRAYTDAGAAVLLLSTLLDRADGELARQSGRFSRHGRRLDLGADAMVTVAVFLALGWGLTRLLGAAAPWLGLLAGAGAAVVFMVIHEAGSPPALLATRSRRVVIDADDAMLLLPPLIWVGQAGVVLVLAAVVTPLVALGMTWRGARWRQAASARG